MRTNARSKSPRAAVVAVATSLGYAPAVHAQSSGAAAPPPAERMANYSAYEQQTIAEVLRDRHLQLDPAPEGKIIERVVVVPLDVFEKRDFIPSWLNVFHATTRPEVLARELLVHPGEPFRQALADDTIRNLRRLPGVPQLSAVLVIAAAGSAPDRVVVVVITKDVWSLRLNWNLVANPGGIESLQFQPSEQNLLGTHQIVSGLFTYEPAAYTIGGLYMIPRIGDSRITSLASANVMVNRQSGKPEGTYGSLVAGEPLFSGDTPWSWDATVSWVDVMHRLYQNAALASYSDRAGQDCSVAGQSGCLPFEWRARTSTISFEVTRSFGWATNNDFTLGATMATASYKVPTPWPAGVEAQTVADFTAHYVPVSDTRVGPSLQYHGYEMRFVRVVDFDTLALQEDYRLGYDVLLRVAPSLRALGATRDVVSLTASAQYTWAMRDGLARVSVQSITEPELGPTHRVADAVVQPTIHLASPSILGLGRIVTDATVVWRWRDYLHTTTTLGGADRLRGYPTNFFVDRNAVEYNFEVRTRPVEILSMQLSGVAFYDVGHAFSDFSKFRPYQSIGAGIRALFPWLDRAVFQADIGFPMERPLDTSTGRPIAGYSYIISLGQAVPVPTIESAPVLPTGQGPDSP